MRDWLLGGEAVFRRLMAKLMQSAVSAVEIDRARLSVQAQPGLRAPAQAVIKEVVKSVAAKSKSLWAVDTNALPNPHALPGPLAVNRGDNIRALPNQDEIMQVM
jgi:hypothetical protein